MSDVQEKREERIGTHWEEAVLLAVLADLLLGDGCGLGRVLGGLGNDTGAVILRSDGGRGEVGHVRRVIAVEEEEEGLRTGTLKARDTHVSSTDKFKT